MITVSHAALVDTICDLYGDFSDFAAHKIVFPISHDRNAIIQMFTDVGMTPDELKINSVEIILKPIPAP